MRVTVYPRDGMAVATHQFNAGSPQFVSVCFDDGANNEVSFLVDHCRVGRFMDMLQRVLDELDAMPAFAETATGVGAVPDLAAEAIAPAIGEECPF